MGSAPKVSVLMSVYNGSRYLRESIESILKQTFTDFEFIIINDGSLDDSPQFIESYARQDSRIIVIHQQNAGLTASLNKGIKLSKGRFIARMDADDISHPDRIRLQVEKLLENSQAGVCHSMVSYIDGDGNYIPLRKKIGFRYSPNQTRWTLIWRNCVFHPTVMIRSDLLKSMKTCYDPNAIGCEDFKLWCRLRENTQFVSVLKPLLKYRKHKESVTSNYDDRLLKSYSDIVSNNLKQGYGINLTEDEARTLAIISGQTKLRGVRLDYLVNARLYINLVKLVKNKFIRQCNGDPKISLEINNAISHQFFRWAKQTMLKDKAAAVKFIGTAVSYASKVFTGSPKL